MKRIAEIIEGRPLYYAESSESVRDVARRMADWNVGAIAILDGETLVGIFSERDLMIRVVAAGLDPDGTAIERCARSTAATSPSSTAASSSACCRCATSSRSTTSISAGRRRS